MFPPTVLVFSEHRDTKVSQEIQVFQQKLLVPDLLILERLGVLCLFIFGLGGFHPLTLLQMAIVVGCLTSCAGFQSDERER